MILIFIHHTVATYYLYGDYMTTTSGNVNNVLLSNAAAAKLSAYSITPMPTINPLTSTVGGHGCFIGGNIMTLNCPSGSTLRDDDIGPLQNPNASMIMAWNRSSGDVRITALSNSPLTFRHVHLFFYNIPAMRIGLPDISLFVSGVKRPYYVTGNQDQTFEDNSRRSVSLSLEEAMSSSTYDINFHFSEESNIDWLLLTEVQICDKPSNGNKLVYSLLLLFWHIIFSLMLSRSGKNHSVTCM